MQKPRQSFWQIWNMSFGFLGIQFGWGLQMANMSAIYEYLGARADQIPILWLAAPLTGPDCAAHHRQCQRSHLDSTRAAAALLSGGRDSQFARAGAHAECSALWMAAGLLWILDASINISMEPFRAFVADMLPEEQRTQGFAMQSLFIGLGAVIASALPWLLTNVVHVAQHSTSSVIPSTVRLSFYLGAAAFLRRGAVDDTHHQGISARRPATELHTDTLHGRGQLWKSFTAIREMPRHDAAAGARAVLHLARPVLHVAVFPGGGGP